MYNINVEFQIRVKQTIEQNGQDKKSESKGETDAANSAKQERRIDNEVGIEVGEAEAGDGESWTSSCETFERDEMSCNCEEGDCKEVVEKTDWQEV